MVDVPKKWKWIHPEEWEGVATMALVVDPNAPFDPVPGLRRRLALPTADADKRMLVLEAVEYALERVHDMKETEPGRPIVSMTAAGFFHMCVQDLPEFDAYDFDRVAACLAHYLARLGKGRRGGEYGPAALAARICIASSAFGATVRPADEKWATDMPRGQRRDRSVRELALEKAVERERGVFETIRARRGAP